MGMQEAWAAMNLEMTDMVQRTEYSADMHWELVEKVTGIHIDPFTSTVEEKAKASGAFRKAWDYGYSWGILINNGDLEKCRTKMGHAEYATAGTDFSNIVECPFEDPEDAFDFQPKEVYGVAKHSDLVARFNADFHHKEEKFPSTLNTTGTYITLVSGLIDVFGWDIMLMAMGIDAKEFGQVANRYADWMQQYFNALADCDSPIINIHDDIVWTEGAFAYPEWYREFVFPNYKKYFAPLKEAGKKIIYTSDGNFTEFIDDIADCGVDGFVMEPCTDMAQIAEKYGKTHSFIGNADTRILLRGTKEDIYNEVKRCMDIGKKCPGFFMAVGNHIPSNTPVENALYYNEVFEKLRRR